MNEEPAMAMSSDYPRDLIGYGRTPPNARWPGGARLAVQIVLNYEEGGERSILHGDAESEAFLQEVVGMAPLAGVRNVQVESVYEYGSRVGLWRLLRLFERRGIKISVFAVAMALERHPEAARALVEAGHEIVSHGWRWIDYQFVDETTERQHMRLAIESIRRVTGSRPLGWYTGRLSPNTRALVVEEGGFLYDADSYNDDLPYWETVGGKAHLVVPYTLDNNDMRFATPQGFNSGDDFLRYLSDAFDVLYAEGGGVPPHDVGRAAHAAGRPARPLRGARTLSRPRGEARSRVDLPPDRHRPPLACSPPARRPRARREAGMSHAPGDLLPSPRILMGAGPTMADPRVLRAMATPLLGQFDPEFTAVMNEVMGLGVGCAGRSLTPIQERTWAAVTAAEASRASRRPTRSQKHA
jgi:allantoinase